MVVGERPDAQSSHAGVPPPAVELARLRDKPIGQIAKDLGIAESGLCARGWRRPTSTKVGARG